MDKAAEKLKYGRPKMTTPIRSDLEVFRERPAKAHWKIPAFCNNDWIALRLAQLCRDLGEDKPFDIAYGAPLCLWAGGRPCAIRSPLSEQEAERYFEAYAEQGITIALTLSKLHVSSSDFADPYCNLLLDIAAHYQAEAIVVDDGLARYIKSTHPEIKLIGSLDKAICDINSTCINETDYYLRHLELYDEIVVRCEYVIDRSLIHQLPTEFRSRIEVIVNQVCIPNCPDCYRHIHAIEDYNDGKVLGRCQACFHANAVDDITTRLRDNVLISNKQINELIESGVRKMKIGGRNASIPKFLDYLSTYIFEPSGAIGPMRIALSREYTEMTRTRFGFSQYSLPD